MEYLLERPPAVGRPEHLAFFVWTVRVSEDRDEQAVGVARI
jgi:hypothetical protein